MVSGGVAATSDNIEVSQTRSGYRSSVNGLVGAMVVTLLLMGGVGLLTLLQHRQIDNAAPTVQYAELLVQARAQAPFGVLAPQPVPAGWRATSAEWNAAGPEKSWHLGFLTNHAEYVGLDQGSTVSQQFVADKTRADQPGAPVQIAGKGWQTLTSGHEMALVRVGGRVTTVVSGTAPQSTLVAFARSLTTTSPSA